MMRSLYSGVSGLQNHQIRMDVVGNNIANVNTTGFKKGRVTFQDMLSQTMSGAARPTDTKGGINPKQIGLGMVIASIDTIHTQGSLQTTGNNLDMAISGNGFFVLNDGDRSFYTRAGAFGLDKDGLLVNPATGLKVQGWNSVTLGGDTFIRTAEDPGDIQIPLYQKDPARATTNIDMKCNLFSEMPILTEFPTNENDLAQNTWSSSINMYDSKGNPLETRMTFYKSGLNQWNARVDVYRDDPDNPGEKIQLNSADGDYNVNIGTAGTDGQNEFIVNFDNLGRIQTVTDLAGNAIDTGNLSVNLNIPGTSGGTQDIAPMSTLINLGIAGQVRSEEGVGVTQFASEFTTKPFRQDGFGMGYLEGLKVDDTGTVTGVFSNGNNRVMAQLALANFTNPGGLEKAGETNFVFSNNSGEPDISPAGSMGKGKIMAGTLEMSNVDLADQFTDMIVTQRGFQANSKTIQTSDQMLQELMTLKR
jgi:flagellar hook protein FlgE